MSVRVYLPLVMSDLAAVQTSGAVPLSARRTAHAVTAGDRADHPGEDEEDLEFEATCQALDSAADRRRTTGERRVVVAADVASVVEQDAWTVVVEAPVALSDVVSFHVEESTGTALGEGYDDLLWYDVTELDQLVAEAG